jgi:hypothetical protein
VKIAGANKKLTCGTKKLTCGSLMKGEEPETRRFLIVILDRMSQHQAI